MPLRIGFDRCSPYGCGEYIYYYGKIEIDNSIFEDAKVTCVLNNLLNNGNTLAETIVKFADESVNLDLVIELVEIQDNSLGNLISQGSNSAFTLQIDKSHAQQRLPIQIATTIMHEAIHAEMRRFLYGATDTSTYQVSQDLLQTIGIITSLGKLEILMIMLEQQNMI